MYCPRCGQQQQNNDTRFCSRCGFLMTGMLEVVDNGGLPKSIIDKHDPNAISPRRKGLMQGGKLMLSGFVIVPILGVLTAMMNGEGFVVGIAAILTFLAGFVRMIYALIFQSGTPTTATNDGAVETIKQELIGKIKQDKALPPQQTEPITNVYQPPAGNWRETSDLQQTSVTEDTTKTLHKKTF